MVKVGSFVKEQSFDLGIYLALVVFRFGYCRSGIWDNPVGLWPIPFGQEGGREFLGSGLGGGLGSEGAEEDLVAGPSVPHGHGDEEKVRILAPQKFGGMLESSGPGRRFPGGGSIGPGGPWPGVSLEPRLSSQSPWMIVSRRSALEGTEGGSFFWAGGAGGAGWGEGGLRLFFPVLGRKLVSRVPGRGRQVWEPAWFCHWWHGWDCRVGTIESADPGPKTPMTTRMASRTKGRRERAGAISRQSPEGRGHPWARLLPSVHAEWGERVRSPVALETVQGRSSTSSSGPSSSRALERCSRLVVGCWLAGFLKQGRLGSLGALAGRA